MARESSPPVILPNRTPALMEDLIGLATPGLHSHPEVDTMRPTHSLAAAPAAAAAMASRHTSPCPLPLKFLPILYMAC